MVKFAPFVSKGSCGAKSAAIICIITKGLQKEKGESAVFTGKVMFSLQMRRCAAGRFAAK
ncbi:MAG: hypothetical protein Q4A66_00015 [Eubacteriales bacterium]|nr:hypothetical protein [Eubacteriales bacterium]